MKGISVTAVSDLHGHYPQLEGGDLLIVAGDLTARDAPEQWSEYFLWQGELPYKKIIFIAGNHDNRLQAMSFPKLDMIFYSPGHKVDYLCDSGTEFEGLKIWGSPWTPLFDEVNPLCKAFMLPEAELEAKFAMIPADTDILITHGPPLGMLDEVKRYDAGIIECVGSHALHYQLYSERIKPRLHVFGHIHGSYGHITKALDMPYTQFVNCSHVNERYQPVNKPIRIVL